MQRRASAAKGTGCHVCGGGFAVEPQQDASAAASLIGGRFGSRFTVLAACDQVWQAACDFARREFWRLVITRPSTAQKPATCDLQDHKKRALD